MPYLTSTAKEYFKDLLEQVNRHAISSPGELNFLCTELCKQFIKDGYNYEKLNAVVGALESCKAEFQRRIVAPYEDEKILKNGDVFNV